MLPPKESHVVKDEGKYSNSIVGPAPSLRARGGSATGVSPDLPHGFPGQSPGRGPSRLHLPPKLLEQDGSFLSFQGAGGENQRQKRRVGATRRRKRRADGGAQPSLFPAPAANSGPSSPAGRAL